MTSESTVTHIKRRYHLHCSCGATVVTGRKIADCPDCGKKVVFRRGWSKREESAAGAPSETNLWPAVQAGNAAPRLRRQEETHDSSKRFRSFGFLMLLLAVALIFLLLVPEGTLRDWRALANNPKPTDCDWITMPVGDKHCHYESKITTLRGGSDGERVVVWYRVND